MTWQPCYYYSPYPGYWSATPAAPWYSFASAQHSCAPLPSSANPPVIALPAQQNWPWPHTTAPPTPLSLRRPHLEPVPPSPEPCHPRGYSPGSPVAPYWNHWVDQAQSDLGWSPYRDTCPQSRRRQETIFLRRKSSSFYSPLKPKFKRLRNPLRRSRHTVPSPRLSATWPVDEASLDSLNLAPRPSGWRIDYTPPHVARGLTRRISRTVRTAVEKNTAEIHYTMTPLLLYTSASTHPIAYDIRQDPTQINVQFLDLARPSNDIDFFQLATSPPVNELCLYHPRLPWYINVCASHPNGVTIGDILTQIYESLTKPISRRDLYNDELSAFDREEMSTAFCYRRGEETGRGMLRMDFLGFDVVFLGLSKTKQGLWEIKTAEAMP
ncbi:hypothetical protein LshimejAT787_0800210 [Lyophyllum shimeji]|uniref:DUF6699 domain-containing protein n=1 Tax=Lyophyllum shimeji TaxID=47721 RepID=A0A9P3UQG3_LYOSH|nr:hypothetical protein LshimejAT787_0800210 [Lyophyllum shimeji]